MANEDLKEVEHADVLAREILLRECKGREAIRNASRIDLFVCLPIVSVPPPHQRVRNFATSCDHMILRTFIEPTRVDRTPAFPRLGCDARGRQGLSGRTRTGIFCMQLIAAEKSCSGFIRIDLGYDGLALQTAMEAVAEACGARLITGKRKFMSLNSITVPGAGVRMPRLFERYSSEAASFCKNLACCWDMAQPVRLQSTWRWTRSVHRGVYATGTDLSLNVAFVLQRAYENAVVIAPLLLRRGP